MNSKKTSIITGKKHSGKTTFLLNRIAELQSEEITVGGLVSVGTFKNGSRFDFKLLDVSTDEKIGFLSQEFCKTCEKIGRFYINPKAFQFGIQVLEKCLKDRIQTIVLDEIGRGTSTFDGISIAWAVGECIHNKTKIGAKTLFATHYHELTDLALSLKGVKNYNIAPATRIGLVNELPFSNHFLHWGSS